MVEWPAEEGALYTLVLSNLDINTRENRFDFEIFYLVKWTNVNCHFSDQDTGFNPHFFFKPTITLGRTLSEFWHWFVANIPGDSVDDGEVTISPRLFLLKCASPRSFLTFSSPLSCQRVTGIIDLVTLS